MEKKISVKLISHTAFPLETIYCIWKISRCKDPVPTAGELRNQIINERMVYTSPDEFDRITEGPIESEFRNTVYDLISNALPLTEMVYFVFEISNMPVSLREQMVRHRIGTKFGDNFGADVVPEVPGSTWWSQTTRVMDMSKFAADQDYYIPPELDESGKTLEMNGRTVSVREFYESQMKWIQSAYRKLVDSGLPVEVARQMLPLAMTHRMTWSVNLASLSHIIGRRSCWIAEMGFWRPVIAGIVEQLATRIDPMFRALTRPPCIRNDGSWKGCNVPLENAPRVAGKEKLPPCPLFMNHHREEALGMAAMGEGKGWKLPVVNDTLLPATLTPPDDGIGEYSKDYAKRCNDQGEFWGRDPHTGTTVDQL